MRLLKYALWALGALVLLVGAVLAFVAATFDPNQYKPQIVQAVKERTQRSLKLDGDIGLAFWPSIGAKIGKASLSERGSEREFAAVEEVRVAVKLMPLLSRQVVVDTVRIKGLHANVVKSKDGRMNFDDLTGGPSEKPASARKKDAPKATPADVQIDIAGVEVADSALTYTDQLSGAKYSISKLTLKTGRIASRAATPVEFSARIQDGAKLDLPVTLKTKLTFDPDKQTAALDDLAFETKGAAAGLSDFSAKLAGSAGVDGAKEHARASLAGKVVDSTVKVGLDVAGFGRPAITFDLEMDQLDVDRFLQPAGAPRPAAEASKGPAKEEPFDLSGLRDLNARGVVKIGALKAMNVRGSNVRLDFKASGGRVDLSPLSANFYQGTLRSDISINAAPAVPVFSVKHDMSGISIGPLLKDLADNDMLEGKGDVTAAVTTQGNTVSSMKKALGGSAGLKLADGAVKGIDIAGTLREAKAKLGALRGEQTQAADKGQKTDFSELTATFKIANGIAHNDDLSLKSPLLRVGGAGDVNIGGDRIDYVVKASIVGTSKGQGGRDLEELNGLTVPVRVSGPLTAPSYKLDLGSTVKDAAKQELKDRLLERLGGKKDEAGKSEAQPGGSTRDKLKELLRR